jgi:pheromone shutdown protein TraB
MITLIGTGHVFDLSQALLEILDERQPQVIGVELDRQRYRGLMSKASKPSETQKKAKGQPLLYRLLGRFQDTMAKEHGVTAGSEMLLGITYAQSHQLPLEFLDMDAQRMFTEMLRSMSLREKLRLVISGIGGMFVNKDRMDDELQKIEGNFDEYLKMIGERFPTVKAVLIDRRNDHMAQRLLGLHHHFEKVVALVGDGHIPGLSQLLDKYEVSYETVRLRTLQEMEARAVDGSQGTFSIQYNNDLFCF